ncbi:MAG: O-antigen ligase family protein [Rubrivivax sp.]|nr:MAG: O-antigen ligase family protein [Rubrivivax sp.]
MSSSNYFPSGGDPSGNSRKFDLIARPLPLLLMVLVISLDYRFLQGYKGAPSFTALEVMGYFTFLLFFADGIVYRNVVREVFSSIWQKNRYIILYAVWIGTLCFANFFRGHGFNTLSELKDLLPSFLMVVVIHAYARSPKAIENIIKVYMVGLGINILLGVAQGLIGAPRPIPMSLGAAAKMDLNGHVMSKNMATGLFTHPNGFAMFLIPCAILLVLVATRKIDLGKWWRAAAWVLLPLLAFAYYRSQGKGAAAWAIMGCIFALLPVRSRGKAFYLMLIGMVLGVLALSAGSVYLADHFRFRSLSTMITRVQLWQSGIDALAHHWDNFFLGSAFGDVYYASYRFTGGQFPYPNTHNGILNQAVAYGVPGLILYLSLVWKAVSGLAFCPDDRLLPNRGVATFAVASIVALLSEYFFEPATEGVLLQAQFFFLLALCLVSTAKPLTYHSAGLLQAQRGAHLGGFK